MSEPFISAHGCDHLRPSSECCPDRKVCTHGVACTHGSCCFTCWRERCSENREHDFSLRFKLVDGGKAPTRGTLGSSGLDCYARLGSALYIPKGEHRVIPLGICIELPEGYEAQVRPRSGMAAKSGVFTCLGTVDQDYRGEIAANLFNFGGALPNYIVNPGDRIAQLVIAPVAMVALEEVAELAPSVRGEQGFGSTGR